MNRGTSGEDPYEGRERATTSAPVLDGTRPTEWEAARPSAGSIATELSASPPARFWPAEGYHQQYLELRGQDASKGSLAPIQCYGDRGPIKKMDKPDIAAVLQKDL